MKKIIRRQENGVSWLNLLTYLLIAYIVSVLILVVLALLLYKMNISEQIVSVGVVITYVLSCFLGGFLAGKKMKQKRFLWGLIMGIGYFLVLLVLSVAINHSFSAIADSLFTTLILCAGGGMLGGMLS